MLPAELVDVRLVPGGDATVRSLAAAVGVVLLSAMAGGLRSLCMRALPVAQAKLHRAWSYSTIPTCERRSIEFRPAGAVALAARAPPASSGLRASCVRACVVRIMLACARFLSDDSQEESSAGREKCAVFRYDSATLHVYDRYIFAGGWGYVCDCVHD
jgi:hypothetical protein